MKKLLFFLILLPSLGFCQTDLSDEVVFTSLEAALRQPENVKVLKLKRKKLKTFPLEILSFPNLKSLDLSSNKLHRLPIEIKKLEQLEILNVSNNKIDKLPESIGDLQNLEVLDVSRNYLTYLPSSVGKLIYLKQLILWSNNIGILPEEVSNLDGRLELLDMRSIQMSPKEQDAIKELLPNVRWRFDHPCNCY